MELEVYKIDGTKTGKKVTVDDSIFGIEPHEHSMWLAIKATLANRRQGTHKIKGRSEVAGSTKKLFRQKGTGRARQGDIKSPLHPGGGKMHGPQPHKYTMGVPKKVRQLARKSALSQKVAANAFYVVEDFQLPEVKTKQIADIVKSFKLDGKKSLLLTASHEPNVYLSGRNIPTLSVIEAGKVSMYDIWKNKAVLVQKSALSVIEDAFAGNSAEETEVEHISLPA
jgi:large subunit ribosomal protein L4